VLDILPIIYTVSSLLSIILAITAIWFSLSVERRLKQNFMNLKSLIELQHRMTKELMDNINEESGNIQSVVYQTQAEIHETLEDMRENCKISNSKKTSK
jgi:hypothetical protein